MKAFTSKYFDLLTAAFVAVIIASNIASTKIVSFWGLTFDAGLILFPLAYIFGDILTEVYGFLRSRRVIWTGFAAVLLVSLTLALVDSLPAASDYPFASDFHNILGQTPRIVIASLVAYLVGEFLNSLIVAWMKQKSEGKYFPVRAIVSTIIGQGADTLIFTFVAFYGVFSPDTLIAIILTNYIVKLAVEVLLLPATHMIVIAMKKSESLDVYDFKSWTQLFFKG